MDKIRVLLVDDQEIIRQGLALIIGQQPDIIVVGQAGDGEAALQLAQAIEPDVVLMDIKMPVMNGIQATRQIRATLPNTRVIILTTYDVDGWVFDGIRAGAQGYLLKDTSPTELINGVRKVHAGESLLDSAIAGKVMNEFRRISGATDPVPQSQPAAKPTHPSNAPNPPIEKLTERESEILALITKGLNNRDIAAQLFLSEGTVRNYVSSIMAKLHANDRTQAVIKAAQHRLVKFD